MHAFSRRRKLVVDLARTEFVRKSRSQRRANRSRDRNGATRALRPTNSKGPAIGFLTQASFEQAVCWIGSCLADALHYAHERGLLHLDLKPSNVLLAGDGQPMLLDFHLAHEVDPARRGEFDRVGGTPGYMSPEQQQSVRAHREGAAIPVALDGRSDIYSLGVCCSSRLRVRFLRRARNGRENCCGHKVGQLAAAWKTFCKSAWLQIEMRGTPTPENWRPTCGGILRACRCAGWPTEVLSSDGKNGAGENLSR